MQLSPSVSTPRSEEAGIKLGDGMSRPNSVQSERELVEVGDRHLSATFLGQGQPLVLLETGFGIESSSWAAVAEGVSKFTRACYYDRAGRGGSERAPQPRSAQDLVLDAHTLLHVTGGSGPFVIAGQSFGGVIARLYAHHYPN